MFKIGFIGAYEKTDLILQIAKLITAVGKKVLIIDSTLNQKTKYIVPFIKPTKTYITEFEDIDVAVGFESFEQINEYLGEESIENQYDFELIDVDDSKGYAEYRMESARINYFVTSFDIYSLKKGIEILSGIKQPQKLKKVIYSNNTDPAEDEYLNFLSANYKIVWDEDKIYFPYTQEDREAIIENQREAKIKFKNLTQQYKECLVYITNQILGNSNANVLRKTLKNIDKGV